MSPCISSGCRYDDLAMFTMSGGRPRTELEDHPQLVPDSIEPILAWRAWTLITDTPRPTLQSITYDTIWTPRGSLTAICGRPGERRRGHGHFAPSLDHGCGIHAVKTREQAWLWASHSPRRLIGHVALWGRVLRFTDGYLAQHAYPKTILATSIRPQTADHIDQLLDHYGIELIPTPFEEAA